MSGKWWKELWIRPISQRLFEYFNPLVTSRSTSHKWMGWHNDGDILILASQVLREQEEADG